MRKRFFMVLVVLAAFVLPVKRTQAQVPILEIIKAAVVKVIKAVDLQIQRLQNKTIWLQNAQKTLENTMSKLKLDEITDWVERQRTLYKDYYDELKKVKDIISYYQRIKDVTQKQVQLVHEYKRAWALFKQDKHFTGGELDYMSKVYTGIVDESVKNMDLLFLVINSFQTQMSDARRLDLINVAADQVEANYYDLVRFNQQNILLSLQRSKSQKDVDVIKKLYRLP